MKIVAACNTILNAALVRSVLSGQDAVSCRLSPAMLAAWEMCLRNDAEALAEQINMDPQSIVEFLDKGPKTVAGLPIEIDNRMPITDIWFKNAAGQVVAKIEGLAVPSAFSVDLERQQSAEEAIATQ